MNVPTETTSRQQVKEIAQQYIQQQATDKKTIEEQAHLLAQQQQEMNNLKEMMKIKMIRVILG